MGMRRGKSQIPSTGNRTVFISYRRTVSWATARLVLNDLVQHDFDVFMDVESINSGDFERIVLAQIAARAHFIALLEPGSLDRIADEGDWLRREISHAITHRRNVVPVTAGGFHLRADLTLPQDIARLTSFNAVSVPHDYFDEAMQKLRERFLRLPRTPQLTQASPTTAEAVDDRIQKALWADPATTITSSGRRLAAPEITAHRDETSIVVTWRAVAEACEYVVERAVGIGFASATIAYRGSAQEYRQTYNVVLPWSYRVRAVGYADFDLGPWSTVVTLRTSQLTTGAAADSYTSWDRLNELVGLDQAKEFFQRLRTPLETGINARERGGNVTIGPSSPHLVFTGNPGVGKTTVAVLAGQLYRDLGLLHRGHCIHVSVDDLVTDKVGTTAGRVRAHFLKAVDGVLLIDQANQLDDHGKRGTEAINVLVDQLDIHQGRLATIITGPPDKMAAFLRSHPKLSNRFPQPNRIEFPDYTPTQLRKIVERRLRHDYGMTLSTDLHAELTTIAEKLHRTRDQNPGNARAMQELAAAIKDHWSARTRPDRDTPLRPATADDISDTYRKHLIPTTTTLPTPNHPHITPPPRPGLWNRPLKPTTIGAALILLLAVVIITAVAYRTLQKQTLARNGPQITQESAPVATETTSSTATTTTLSLPITIRVYNGSKIDGLAAQAADDFRRFGYHVDEIGDYPNGPNGPVPTSTVYFRPGTDEQAAGLGLAERFRLRVEPRFAGIENYAPGLIVIVTNDYGSK
jgi:LytR cell envelope-related transcriptional attenuator/ATPase family associated with various cellular activities (AAA)/TIR domain